MQSPPLHGGLLAAERTAGAETCWNTQRESEEATSGFAQTGLLDELALETGTI
ncbi:MAG: hypothetical protein RMK20_00125 [Verrucomicrobiales bacterium]|nr:hypothetical protein [Verrucomicrobiales bacterium]